MEAYKRFKDPIYGYINIQNKIISNIVDTSEFQRLRNVVQTSYAPLYASAVHNRFVHSLGVYYLGKIVQKSIWETLPEELDKDEMERYLFVFEVACLLHDVGHAPFSHTGENFYLVNGDRGLLHKEIVELTGDRVLEQEIDDKSYVNKAAPHELMSVIVGLRRYGELFESDEEKSFFARCITGYTYAVQADDKHSFLNCIISLLNSAVIDVDKLDYLIRDAYITGFDTINIDYQRLLTSIKAKKSKERKNSKYEIVYTKGALSVIENVVYAHDAERKWIQNHPIVQYEGYLLRNVVMLLNQKYGNPRLFSYESLTIEGRRLTEEFKVSLLCDADVLFLMKNLEENDSVKEYFERNERRHPLWKSESEYKALFDTCFNEQTYDVLDEEMDELFKYLNFINKAQVIDEESLQACEKDIEEIQSVYAELCENDKVNQTKYQESLEKKEWYRKWISAFKEFANEEGIDFNFVVLKQDQFNSGFAKEKFSELRIEFPELKNLSKFEQVTNVLTSKRSLRKVFFYVFYKRKDESDYRVNVLNLVDKLNQLAKKKTMR